MNTRAQTKKVFEEIKALVNLRFDNLQTFQEMYHTFTEGETAIVSGTQVELLKKSVDHLQFRTIIQPGADRGFSEHWHDCLEECTVISGEMADLIQMHKRATGGEKIVYQPYQAHMPYNPGDKPLVIEVNFYK